MNDDEAMARARELGWEVHPLMRGDQTAGYAMVKGTEVHFKVVDGFEHKAIRRNGFREFSRPILDKFGLVTTRVPKWDSTSRRFVERVGFKETWADDTFNYFMLTALPFEK